MNKMEKIMDNISKFICESYDRRKNYNKQIREGITLPIKEAKDYLKENKERKTRTKK
ncbi:MAG: hypothetical protein ACRCYC_12210 [Paraclostridium sp.]|uniref:hypothetical protein n=1 Tax=Paraclostridium sp. TaxID=2023273 RepID=UPI003F36348E